MISVFAVCPVLSFCDVFRHYSVWGGDMTGNGLRAARFATLAVFFLRAVRREGKRNLISDLQEKKPWLFERPFTL